MAATTIDDYLAALPDERRVVVEELRRTIRAAAPEATETIAYKMPALRSHGGQFLVSYDAYKHHYSLFPASGAVVDALGDGAGAVPGGEGDHPLPGRQADPGRASSRRSSRCGSRRTPPDRGRGCAD